MSREVVLLAEERGRRERDRADEEERGRQPEHDPRADERLPALAAGAEPRCHEDAGDRGVGEGRVDRRRAHADRDARLIGRVEEEERHRRGEGERLRRRVPDERPHRPGGRVRPGQRLGRHRADCSRAGR